MNSPVRPELLKRLRTLLQSGPIDAASACAQLDISQPTFSRLRKAAGQDIVTLGAARSTRYAMTRQMRDMGSAFPIYEVQPDGSASPDISPVAKSREQITASSIDRRY